jgi:hypothetical protein
MVISFVSLALPLPYDVDGSLQLKTPKRAVNKVRVVILFIYIGYTFCRCGCETSVLSLKMAL